MKKHFGLLVAGFSLATSMSAYALSQDPVTQDKKQDQTTMPDQPNTARPDPGQMGPGKMGTVPMAQMGQVKPAAPSHKQMRHKKPKKGTDMPGGMPPADKTPEAGH